MTRITASSHGELQMRMLRIVRRGDRHDPRDLTVALQFEGAFGAAFTDGRAAGLPPGEVVKNHVHAAARRLGAREIEELGVAIATSFIADRPQMSRVRVEITEAPWERLVAGGKPQAQTFVAGSSERRVATVTTNGQQLSVTGGLAGLSVMRSAGFTAATARLQEDAPEGVQPLLVGTLGARWTYTSGDVTFNVFRQGLRAAILDTVAWHESRSVHHALHAVGDVLLSTYEAIADVTLTFHERPYRPVDLFAAGAENPDELFVVVEEPVGLVEVTVERDGAAV